MRPNSSVYDRYRWKKMDQQPLERNQAKSGGGGGDSEGGHKIPVLTGGATTTSGSPPRTGSGSAAASSAGSGTTPVAASPSRRAGKRKNSAINLPSGHVAARKRRKLQQAQLKVGEPPSGTGGGGGGGADQVPQTKNTVAVLNELKRNLVYNLESQSGPVHAPLFTMSVVVDSQKFIGHGRSKKLARIEAAAAALRSFIQFKDGATLTPIKPLQNVDFTSDDPMIENSIFPLSDPVAVLPEQIETVTPEKKSAERKSSSEKGSKEQNGHNNNNNNNNNNNTNNNNHSTNNSNSPCQPNPHSNFSHHNNTTTSYYHQNASHNNTTSLNSNCNSHNTTSGYSPSHPPGPFYKGPSQSHHGHNPNLNQSQNHYTSYNQQQQHQQYVPKQYHHQQQQQHHNHSQVVPHPQPLLAQPMHHHHHHKNNSYNSNNNNNNHIGKNGGGTVKAYAAANSNSFSTTTITNINNKLKASAVNASRNVAPGQPPKPQPEKGPVMLLHELFTDAHFECVSTDGLQHSKFTVVVSVDTQRFEGTGPSKKMAKNAAAKAALASLCNISFSPLQQAKFGVMNSSGIGGGGGGGGIGPGGTGGLNTGGLNPVAMMGGFGSNGDLGQCCDHQGKNVELPQTFADSVGKLVIEKFNEVMKGNDVYSRRKVLAGIVMTQGYDVKSAKVIALATGTKCVSGEHMSVTGSVINDSHAEIIARRGLLDFFYTQLDQHCKQAAAAAAASTNNGNNNNTVAQQNGKNGEQPEAAEPEPSIFVRPTDGSSKLYRLKDGIYFHLYINTAPCGDARVFSPHENDNMDVDKHPNRKARGQLRTKVESGEGTIPVKSSEGIQTWDGVLQGQRLLTMSCSDKISRWNVLGLQGSLLASVIEPIYLHSIVLGSLLHPAHMYRAICGRVENSIQGLPPPYRLNKPRLALMTSAESRNQTKPPNFSINWVIGCQEVEIVNSFTGKLINNNTNTNKMSRLSKQSFYRRYAAIIERLPEPAPVLREVLPTYFETKMAVPEYQQAKKELFAAFAKEDLGDWLKKPIEQDQFTLIPPKPEELALVQQQNQAGNNGVAPVGNGNGPTQGGK
ncbi:double-stranded RNA-specific editase Adar isoform X3 [Culex quinquefasciatus]|uniref:double-stranded RNA-specific editase Adar isoform X3 n=1 Tax=Culex quinquefasciatus TaxID=7176 RepID=UPI0018E2AF4F|nr:double-stranded RNA-specific editase Adar isoform X3 [Culex quinquefasciatus]